MRSYGRPTISLGPPLTPAVKQLIIATSAVFLLTYIPAQLFGWTFPIEWLALSPYGVTHKLYLWQLVTYLFLHAGWLHIIFNLFAVWMFGSDLERLWGSKKFLFYYFLTGAGAGAMDVLFRPSSTLPTVGCSGAVFGILLAYGMLFPNRVVLFALIIPMKAKWFVALIGLITFVNSFSGSASGVSHIAHLGGMLIGFIYLRGGGLPNRLQLHYHEWRRARLRRKFEVYMRDQDRKDKAGRWIN